MPPLGRSCRARKASGASAMTSTNALPIPTRSYSAIAFFPSLVRRSIAGKLGAPSAAPALSGQAAPANNTSLVPTVRPDAAALHAGGGALRRSVAARHTVDRDPGHTAPVRTFVNRAAVLLYPARSITD